MNKREKIILGVMCLALLYGAYELFFASSSRKATSEQNVTADKQAADEKAVTAGSKQPVKPGNTVDELVKKVNETLADATVSDAERYIIASAETKWAQDPFLAKKPDSKYGAAGGPESQVNIRYTGFIEMAERRLAILNGQEYEAGEEIPPGGYILRKVDPDRVVVQNKGDQREVTIGIVEEKW